MLVKETKLFGRDNIKVFAKRPSNLAEVLLTSLENYKQKEAVVTEGGKLTYEQLDAYSTIIAAHLQQRCGVKKGDRVATIIGNHLTFPLMVFACIKLGALMVPVNVKLSPDEIAYILGHSDVKVIVSEDKYVSKINNIKEVVINIPKDENIFVVDGDNSFQKLLENKYQLDAVVLDELDPVFILYTSGTTGRPKGAVLTHINVIHSLINYENIFKTDETMKTLIAIPMFHVTGLVGQLLHMIYVGGTVYSMESYQNKRYIEYIIEHRINFLFNVPTIFIMMSTDEEFKQHSFDFVRKVAFGGSPIYQQTYRMLQEAFPNAKLHNAYGATETSSPATLMPISYSESKVTSVGMAVPVADMKVVDAAGKEVPVGEIGEIYIKGPMVIKEYWRNQEANEKSFSDGYWHSGDLGAVDDDGFFYIRDRIKDMINRGGEKIFSIEVEDILKKHELVKEAAVVGEPDPVFGERVKAFIVSDQLREEDIPSIKAHCLQHLAKYKVPEVYQFIEALPRNASGKILKHTLKNN